MQNAFEANDPQRIINVTFRVKVYATKGALTPNPPTQTKKVVCIIISATVCSSYRLSPCAKRWSVLLHASQDEKFSTNLK